MTTSEPSPNDICYMCKNTREWHENHYARHAFSMTPTELRDTARDDRRAQTESERAITRTTRPFDPVLRLALIEAGVITIQQLADAENKLSFISEEVNRVTRGESDGREPSSVDADPGSG